MASSKVRLLSKGANRCKYPLPIEVIVDNIVRKVKPNQYSILLEMTVSEIGIEVEGYLKKELNSQIQGSESVKTRIFKAVYDQVHELLKDKA